MAVTKTGAFVRGLVIVAIAVLTPIGSAIEAGKPLDTAVWFTAGLAGLIALRAYLDQSISRVEP